MSVSASAAPTPRTTSEKYGSAKNRASGSGITRAMASLRLAARARAARFGTYPSSVTAASTAALVCSLTLEDPLITRDTVPRPTPARTATSSRVGRPPLRPFPFMASSRL